MSNEQVVLQMVANRLAMLMEQFTELKSRYGAEMTELVHLAQGVITETPPERTLGDGNRHADGRYHVPLSADEIEFISETINGNTGPEDWTPSFRNPIVARFADLNETVAQDRERDEEREPDDDPGEPYFTPEPYAAETLDEH